MEDLFRRYSSPVVIVNLVKAQEKKPRETILLKEFGIAIDFLNNLLPPEHRIVYYAWDFHKAAKRCIQFALRGWLVCPLEALLPLTRRSLKRRWGVCASPASSRIRTSPTPSPISTAFSADVSRRWDSFTAADNAKSTQHRHRV
jgi:hypothetical protein